MNYWNSSRKEIEEEVYQQMKAGFDVLVLGVSDYEYRIILITATALAMQIIDECMES